MTVAVQDVQNGRMIGWLQWGNIVGFLYKEEEAAEKELRKMTEDYYSIGVQENISMFSKSRVIVIA